MDRKGVLLVFSGPSGAGKGAVCKALRESNPNLLLSISATTRPPRSGEVDGVNYYFVKSETFKKMIEEKYDWNIISKKMENIFNRLCAS